jgi:hypothetical protein
MGIILLNYFHDESQISTKSCHNSKIGMRWEKHLQQIRPEKTGLAARIPNS